MRLKKAVLTAGVISLTKARLPSSDSLCDLSKLSHEHISFSEYVYSSTYKLIRIK